ncbi:MAG: hypothetical protein E7671_00555 [Ruminococcaceae bacterium]|nr:hypothetical protein [Oscillospiraceae bacterium]
MTAAILIDKLKSFIENSVKDFSLPERVQEGDTEEIFRAPNVYKLRLDSSGEAKKKAPYIIIQLENGAHKQVKGENAQASVNIRLIFCVYHEDEQEGAVALLNVIEKVRMDLLRHIVIGGCFKLDTEEKLEWLIYNEDTAPYYAGEMIGTFLIPPIEREAETWLKP